MANKSPEKPAGARSRKRGPKGPAIQKYRRDLAIYRGWLGGRTAVALAREHGLSDRQIREVARDMRESSSAPTETSPEQIVDEVIVRTEEGISDLARAGDRLNGAARLRAISAYLKALEGYFRLLEKAGRVPTDPNRMLVDHDLELTLETIINVFERHHVSVEAQREIRDILRGSAKRLGPGGHGREEHAASHSRPRRT